jgi:hypothetical protein
MEGSDENAISFEFAAARIYRVALAAFTGAVVAYEGDLFVVSATLLGGTDNFIPATMTRILEINAAAFPGLLVLNRLVSATGR